MKEADFNIRVLLKNPDIKIPFLSFVFYSKIQSQHQKKHTTLQNLLWYYVEFQREDAVMM